MTETLYALTMLCAGLLFGSFFNVVAIRAVRGESIVHPPSHCMHCKRELRWFELVPVASYAALGGRCRSCRQRISPRYPIGELAGGVAFVLAYRHFGFQPELAVALLLVSILIIVTQTDLDERIIPDKVVASGVIGAVGLRFWSHPLPWWDYAAAALLGSGVLLFAGILGEKLLKREAMGGGDIKLYVFIGLVLGMQATAVSLLFASLSGVVFGLFWRIKKGNEPIPFGPFIAAGALCAYLWGNPLVEWYARLLA